MSKIDLKQQLKHLYLPTARKVTVVDVPEMQFVKIDGVIGSDEAPETSKQFQEAMGALYGASYTLKFMSKLDKVNPIDFTVMALEALWWTDSGQFSQQEKEPWYFTAMMLQPDHISHSMFEEALVQVAEKKPGPAYDLLSLERFAEGLSIQIMHVGPYADEPRSLDKMRRFAEENGYAYRGKHHEIYIGDPRRSKPENLRTVLRQPVEMKG